MVTNENIIERMMDNVEFSVNNRTKKFVDKADVKKLKISMDK